MVSKLVSTETGAPTGCEGKAPASAPTSTKAALSVLWAPDYDFKSLVKSKQLKTTTVDDHTEK